MPSAWIASSPSASPAASVSTEPRGSGPWLSTASASDGPGTYAVTSQGRGASRSASTTGAVNMPLTCRAAATSRANLTRNSRSAASSLRISFTATSRPPGTGPGTPRPCRRRPVAQAADTGRPAGDPRTAAVSQRRTFAPSRSAGGRSWAGRAARWAGGGRVEPPGGLVVGGWSRPVGWWGRAVAARWTGHASSRGGATDAMYPAFRASARACRWPAALTAWPQEEDARLWSR